MERRYERGYERGHRHDVVERDHRQRRRLFDGPEPSRRAPISEVRGREARPVREWEHERSNGSWRAGDEWERSPREHDAGRYGYGSAAHFDDGYDDRWRAEHGRELPHRDDYDDRHNWRDSPADFGERSYAGFAEWDERDDPRAMRGGEEEYARDRDAMHARHRSGAARWDSGRGGAGESTWRRRVPEEVQAGRFAGRGPRGYQRSDERIREDVCDLLLEADHIDASDVTVHVSGGEVTLEGSVPSRSMKRAAEDLVDAVSGVVNVSNQLRVRASGTTGAVDSSGHPVA